jgi:hypothetical protein
MSSVVDNYGYIAHVHMGVWVNTAVPLVLFYVLDAKEGFRQEHSSEWNGILS